MNSFEFTVTALLTVGLISKDLFCVDFGIAVNKFL